jgi:CRP-like cAMP-binding protein
MVGYCAEEKGEAVHTHSGLTVAEIFADLAPRTLEDFEALGQNGKYPPGATLFEIGETCSGVFWVSSGQVRVSVSDSFGQRVMSRVAQPGELLGLKAALCGELHEATARTEGPSEVSFLSRDSLSGFLSSHPDAAFRIVQRLSDRLSVAMDQFRLVSDFAQPKPLN